ncbi:hypothetical protein NP493_632g01008 [Ridgeia piscesae]|uniref:Uncharacterized protein n=1 Tax=Ridgeia piscesae TaxID=27915 RepID=A0AAD9KSZ6_RIDPI|nr:hypothetical protein NP493_632g01008 [Ridgeia piscesae]
MARDKNVSSPAYRNGYSSPRTCDRDGECDVLLGEVCRWGYEGCTLGQCMCRVGEHMDVRKNKCTPRRLGQETCNSREDQCIQGMDCVDNRCQCSTGEMTDDRTFCLRHNQRLLGGSCRRSRDCLQKSPSGYTNTDVACDNGICQCERGLKRNNLRCQKRKIGERGCTANDHCYGGALCRDSTCTCPPRYTVTSSGTKCARREVSQLRYSGAVAQWRSGAVAQWRSGAVAQWRSGAVAQWRSGAVAQWRSSAVAQWRSGAVAQWRSGAVAQWLEHRTLD